MSTGVEREGLPEAHPLQLSRERAGRQINGVKGDCDWSSVPLRRAPSG